MTLTPGTRLGSYEIVAAIGVGGMGEVYRAHDARLGRDVAVKVLPPGFAADTQRLSRFEQEAKALAALSHPNILAVHDVGTHKGLPYLVMELLEGETLRERLASGALPVRRAAELALQMAQGLAAAHAKGLVHRDLKPANLFITRDGHLKILDFGLAKQASMSTSGEQSQLPTRDARSLTSEGLALGTVGYMSPEQVTGKPADARSDLFAFGVVLYEMLSGRRAFERNSAFETLNATLREEPPELDSPAGPVPEALQRLVAHCLEKEPARRFQSAQDLVYDLEAVLAGPTSVAGKSGALAPVPGRRPRPLMFVVAALLIAAAGGGLLFWKPWNRTLPPAHIPSVVALPAKVFGGLESAFLTDAIPDTLSTLLAGVEGLDTKVPPTSAQVEKVQGDVARVAEAYRAEFLVLTTVTAEGDRLHLNVKLAEGATQKVRWASQYEGTRASYANLLRDAAEGLTRALKPPGSAAVGAPTFRSDVELALREGRYFQGRYYRTKQAQDFNQALAAFKKAQSLDPSSAQLAAEIANLFQDMYFVMRDAKAGVETERWATRALELDPRCGWAWVARTHIEANRPRVNQATVVASALKAARYAPTDARTYTTLGSIAPTAGFQAATGFRAMELDPLNTWGYSWAAMCLTLTGRAEEALPILERAVRVQPRPGFHTWLKYFALFHAGRFEDAKQAYTEAGWEEVSRLMRSLMAGDTAAGRQLARGYLADWRKAELGSMDWVNRVTFYGPLLVRLGMNEEALWALDKSAATGFPPSYDFLLLDPDMKQLRGDPRYAKTLEASRNYALLFLQQADEAKMRGEFPNQMESALGELRELVNRNP